MKLYTELANNRFAELIPENLYDDWSLFGNKLTDTQVNLISTPLADFLNNFNSQNPELKPSIIWICLALGNPDVSSADLLNLATELKIELKDLVYFAASIGRLALVEDIFKLTKTIEEKDELIKYFDYKLYRAAVLNKQLGILKIIEQQAPHLIQNMIQSDNFESYRDAAANNDLLIMKHLEHLLAKLPIEPEQKNKLRVEMITAVQHSAYRTAANAGYVGILEHIEEMLPSLVMNMIRAENYDAYRWSALYGRLNTLQHFEALAPDLVPSMLQADNFGAFRWAISKEHEDIVNHMLSHPVCFAHAEPHEYEYKKYTLPFIERKLSQLTKQKQAMLALNQHAIFNLSNKNEIHLCFYLLRHLIRNNHANTRDHLHLLLDIPEVKAIVHTQVTPGEPNELLRLALAVNNEDAAIMLLGIPAVRQEAERHNFYHNEVNNGIDERILARDCESSMRALTPGEKKRLDAAIKHYKPIIDEKGVACLMQEVRQQLIKFYEANPAISNGIKLPMDWQAFKNLKLHGSDYEQALEAYYQHPVHTAWRYLLKPNPWMSLEASYINVNPNNLSERWSSFDEYQALIVMFWLGANDVNTPPTKGHTLEGRIYHFICELALVARAHNWDSSRINANGAKEEYDDLKGDKPVCYAGVKRHLFQSVIGHPLLSVLTLEDINSELFDFVRQHFLSKINDNNRDILIKAFDDCIKDPLDEDATSELKKLDITKPQIKELIIQLEAKYFPQFDFDPQFKKLVLDTLELKEYKGITIDVAHAIKFDNLVGLRALLAKQAQASANPKTANTSAIGNFGGNSPSQTTTSNLPETSSIKASL